jgi:hypothetical protein
MKQPILVVMEVPDGTDVTALANRVQGITDALWAVPLHYTIDVPEGAITA